MTLLAAGALSAGLLAGCGSSRGNHASAASTSPSAYAGIVTPGAHEETHTGEAVAYVAGTPIAKATYRHWVNVERASGASGDFGHRALGFLITSSWVLGEAARRKVSVSGAEAKTRLASLEHKSFPKTGQLHIFLAKSKESKADLLSRVKVEMLSGKIAEDVAGKATGAQRKAALSRFEQFFKVRWKRLTSCKQGYVMEDCKQYKGKGEDLSASGGGSGGSAGGGSGGDSSGSGAHSSAAGATGSSSASSPGGEVHSAPGSFAVESPAFERNGAIPAVYTCDGKGISPPLRWSHVPKGASQLVLFVIDDSADGANGGIRWVLGGIDPKSTSVAAGETPPDAIVGANAEGDSSYGAICPARGKTDTIELVMYALKQPIKLSPGFAPSVAESEYGSSKDLLGEAAVTYATYRRK